MENMFEFAIKNKLRFAFKGMVSVEDLYDLTVQSLDSIFKSLNAQVKQVKEESLLNTKNQADKVLETQIEIVKYIVKGKLEEENTRLQAKTKREQKQKLMAILASKQDEALLSKTSEEVQAMINELE